MENINYGILVDPEKMYPVTYTIKQDGTKVYGNTFLKGSDLTEPQIKELIKNTVCAKCGGKGYYGDGPTSFNKTTCECQSLTNQKPTFKHLSTMGQELNTEELRALESVGKKAENWYAVMYNENSMPIAIFSTKEYAEAYRNQFSSTSIIEPWPMIIRDYSKKQ